MTLALTHKDLSVVLDALNVCMSDDNQVPTVFLENDYKSAWGKVEEYLESFVVDGSQPFGTPMVCERCGDGGGGKHLLCQTCLQEYAALAEKARGR